MSAVSEILREKEVAARAMKRDIEKALADQSASTPEPQPVPARPCKHAGGMWSRGWADGVEANRRQRSAGIPVPVVKRGLWRDGPRKTREN